jgi:hypothetical protein
MRWWVLALVPLALGCGLRRSRPAPAPVYRPADAELTARICIERPSAEGGLQVREATVLLTVPQTFTMTGGQAVCTWVLPGAYSAMAYSADPLDPAADDPRAWTSEPTRILAPAEGVVALRLVPRQDKPGWAFVPIEE